MTSPSPEVRERLYAALAHPDSQRFGIIFIQLAVREADIRTLLAQSTEDAARIEALEGALRKLCSELLDEGDHGKRNNSVCPVCIAYEAACALLTEGTEPQRVNFCHGDRDGDCSWSNCPQLRDNEPEATGRHCPLDKGCSRCGYEFEDCEC